MAGPAPESGFTPVAGTPVAVATAAWAGSAKNSKDTVPIVVMAGSLNPTIGMG